MMSEWQQVLKAASDDHSERGIIGVPDWRILRAFQQCAAALEAQSSEGRRLAGQNTTMRAILQIIKPEALEAMDSASDKQEKPSGN
jgi:hypothetical protein